MLKASHKMPKIDNTIDRPQATATLWQVKLLFGYIYSICHTHVTYTSRGLQNSFKFYIFYTHNHTYTYTHLHPHLDMRII